MKSKLEFYIKKNKLVQFLYKVLISLFFKFLSIVIKTQRYTILFNGHGKRFNDSPRVLYEAMRLDEGYCRYNFYWAVDKPELYNIPGAKIIKQDSLKYFFISLRAKIWISCVNIERGLKYKKKSTIYLNTWHGIPLKHVGNKVTGRRDFDFSHIDIFCASGNYDKEIYIKDFNVKEESVIISGLPRNDVLIDHNPTQIEQLRNKLEIPKGKKVVLYAPTWRDNGKRNLNTTISPPINIRMWEEVLGDNYVILFRAHAYTASYLNLQFNSFIRDYSSYEDINDLMLVSDVLISDYSATILDYSILNRPILCFGYDYESYRKDRGLYLDLDEILPYGVIRDEDSLILKLLNIHEYDLKLVKQLNSQFFEYNQAATIKCIEKLKTMEAKS